MIIRLGLTHCGHNYEPHVRQLLAGGDMIFPATTATGECRLESIYDSSLLRNHTIPYIHICVSNSRSGARTHDLLGFTQKVNRPGLIAVPRRPSALPASVQWFATHCRSIHLVTLRCRYHTLPRRGTTGLMFMCESSSRQRS